MKTLITLAAALVLPAAAGATPNAVQASKDANLTSTQDQNRSSAPAASEPPLAARHGEALPEGAPTDKPSATAADQATAGTLDKPAPQKPAN